MAAAISRATAGRDALAAAAAMRQRGATALLIDISARPHEAAAGVAAALGARYLRLPSADAATLSRVVGREVAAVSTARGTR